MRKVRLSSIFIASIKGESDLYVALPVTSYSSGCNPLQSPCVAAPCNPHCRSYARRRMQRKHFKGPRAVDRVSRACHRLSNSLNISGIDHPRKFLFPLRGSARSPPRVYATNTDRSMANTIFQLPFSRVITHYDISRNTCTCLLQ